MRKNGRRRELKNANHKTHDDRFDAYFQNVFDDAKIYQAKDKVNTKTHIGNSIWDTSGHVVYRGETRALIGGGGVNIHIIKPVL